MIVTDQVNKVKQVFDFCFADEEKRHPYQIQLNYTIADWNDNSVSNIEEFFKADLIRYHKRISTVDPKMIDMGFTVVGKLVDSDPGFNAYEEFLNHHYNKAFNKLSLIESVKDCVLAIKRTRVKSFGGQIEEIPATLTTDEFDIDIHAWLNKKERATRLLASETNQALTKDKSLAGKNIFNKMPLPEVAKYFHEKLGAPGKNKTPYLSHTEINLFISRAFCGNKDIKPLTINRANGEKGNIVDIFYKYYVICTTDYTHEDTIQSQDKYKSLIDDNFTNMGTFNFRRKK